MSHGPSVSVFVAQIAVLLISGRLMGELMQRLRQPPVMGQILAGVLLGPSVLGALLPGLSRQLFPAAPEQQAMLDAISQLGVLLLLLMTGMETDLAVFRDARRTAISISLCGIVIPFACGIGLGSWLPDSLLPDPDRRLITTLFLGTALSISSVKIVALVVRDLGFLRRTVGQVIVASAIIDDTIGWLIMAVTFGLASRTGLDISGVTRAALGTAVFLVIAFTVGRRLVFRLIRWSNDHFISEMPVITMIVTVMLLMALLTQAIGVHLVLGSFMAGVLIGQSPILTRHIGEQLRGMVVALFMPVFFGLAGLATDFGALFRSDLLLLTLVLILVASIGKFSGAFVGGRIGGLSYRESLAVGCGMNARGSTEVIVASIGLSLGVLSRNLFTAIVAMAVVTTTAMPPMLRWALGRLPLGAEEKARLEREEFESQGFVNRIERLLVTADDSASGKLASRLAGLLAGSRRIATTLLHLDDQGPAGAQPAVDPAAAQAHFEQAAAAVEAAAAAAGEESTERKTDRAEITTRVQQIDASEEAIAAERRKGYGLLVIGREPAAQDGHFDAQITRSVESFQGPFAIAVARERGHAEEPSGPLKILVPITGTATSRDGAELAIALAQATQGSVTALYVAGSTTQQRVWRLQLGSVLAPRNSAEAAVREIVVLGEHYGVTVQGVIRRQRATQNAILREADSGQHTLLVMGVSPRPGQQLFLGEVAAEILHRARCSLLFVSGEHR